MQSILSKADQLELRACLTINGLSQYASARALFRVVSRLGDGVAWYVSMIVLSVLGGLDAAAAMFHVGLTSCVGVYLYRYLKNRLVRPRPYVSHGQIVCQIAPLDQYSFPSGHTLHAVLFTTMLAVYAPWTLIICMPFALLVAMSRIVLGLHYPSDVLVGAMIGITLGVLSLSLVPAPEIAYATSVDEWLAIWSWSD
ncbi:MAG: phosphatase PAP2 family protein [Pseudomonadota bacterium]